MAKDVVESLRKHRENDRKRLPKLLKYLKKIPNIQKYEDYKDLVKINIINWFIEVQIRAFLIFITFMCLSVSKIAIVLPHPPQCILLAEGISLLWFLLTELKKDIWRK